MSKLNCMLCILLLHIAVYNTDIVYGHFSLVGHFLQVFLRATSNIIILSSFHSCFIHHLSLLLFCTGHRCCSPSLMRKTRLMRRCESKRTQRWTMAKTVCACLAIQFINMLVIVGIEYHSNNHNSLFNVFHSNDCFSLLVLLSVHLSAFGSIATMDHEYNCKYRWVCI